MNVYNLKNHLWKSQISIVPKKKYRHVSRDTIKKNLNLLSSKKIALPTIKNAEFIGV